MIYLLTNQITADAAAVIVAHRGTIVTVHEMHPHIQLVTLHGAISHGRHPKDQYMSYTLNQASKEGICYWDGDPCTRTIYRWSEDPNDANLFRGADGQIWPAGLAPEQARIRPRIGHIVTAILAERDSSADDGEIEQIERLMTLQAAALEIVLPLLPDDVRQALTRATRHVFKVLGESAVDAVSGLLTATTKERGGHESREHRVPGL